MTFVPHSRVLPRSLWRPALFLFAVAQMLLAFAPLLEGRTPLAQAHAEEAGTTLHHAHNEADCTACFARSLLASAVPGSQARPSFSRLALQHVPATAPWLESAWSLHSRSRAPPSLLG